MASGGHEKFVSPNPIRSLEMQRRLALVTCARWLVIHSDGTRRFISSDLGLCRTTEGAARLHGWWIPLDPRTALALFPVDVRFVARYGIGGWSATIEHADLVGEPPNSDLAQAATEFLYAESLEDLVPFVPLRPASTSTDDDLYDWPFSGSDTRKAEFVWHRLASLTEHQTRPAEIDLNQDIDFPALAQGWTPSRLWLGVNAPPPGFNHLFQDGDQIGLRLRVQP